MEALNWIVCSTKPIAMNAIINYFLPIIEVFSSNKKTDKTEENKNIYIINKAVCVNQGGLIQYYYLASEKHRLLKDCINNETEKNNLEKIRGMASDLINFLNTEFHRQAFENFNILQEYFSGRNATKPRICIKGSFKTENKDRIVTVFRDSKTQYISDSEVDSNTGFQTIKVTGRYYLENNIPQAANHGHYKNPRLNISKLKDELRQSAKEHRKISWNSCWNDSESQSDQLSFYKSTLIVPMTIWNNKFSVEFKHLAKLKDIDRTVFGFLCFDHIEENFFKEDDIPVGYIVADLLSIYLFVRIAFTEISNTFSRAESQLTSHSMTYDMDILSLKDEFDSALNKITQEAKFSKPLKSKHNYLFPVDDVLLNYARSLNTGVNEQKSPITGTNN